MNREIKEAWLAALRSGAYRQARGTLVEFKGGIDPGAEVPVAYCCLGVLTDLYCKNSPAGKANDMGILDASEGSEVLSEPVQKWAGLECGDPRVGTYSLSVYNDGHPPTSESVPNPIPPRSFKEIADLIEEYL